MGSHENQTNLIITSSSDMSAPASPKDTPAQPQPLDLNQEPSASTEAHQDIPLEKHSDDDAFGDFGTSQGTFESNSAKDDDDGFGDFGSSEAFKSSDNNDEDDEFGDFGATSVAITTGDDDDGFGDFGEVQAGGDNDDFGDFNDFGEDGFQDSGDFGDFEGGDGDEDPFGSSEPVAEPPAPVVEEEPVEVAMACPFFFFFLPCLLDCLAFKTLLA